MNPRQDSGNCVQSSRDGFRVVGLRSERIEIAVVPQLGAKILSLTNRQTHRQWLWLPSNTKLFANKPGDPFEKSTLVGADECIPSISPCQVKGRSIADHGEAWSRPWEVDEQKLLAGQIVTSLRLDSPLRLERGIFLRGQRGEVAHLDYRLTNLSDVPQPFLWAFHPLMTIQPGDELVLPIASVSVAATTLPDAQPGDEWKWPSPRAGLELNRFDLGPKPGYVKLFATALPRGEAKIVNGATGERLCLRFDAGKLPALGIWITRGGWNGYHHFAVEPTHVSLDSLAEAIANNACPVLPARGQISWNVQLELSCDS